MDKSQADQLRKQAHARYNAAINKAKHDLDRDLEAIERVERLLSAPSPHSTSEGPSQTRSKPGQRKHGKFAALVREAIADIGEQPFKSSDIFARIGHEYDISQKNVRASVSSTLKRLFEAGELELIEQGTGKNYSIYRRKEVSSDEASQSPEVNNGRLGGNPPTVEGGRDPQKDDDGLRV